MRPTITCVKSWAFSHTKKSMSTPQKVGFLAYVRRCGSDFSELCIVYIIFFIPARDQTIIHKILTVYAFVEQHKKPAVNMIEVIAVI